MNEQNGAQRIFSLFYFIFFLYFRLLHETHLALIQQYFLQTRLTYKKRNKNAKREKKGGLIINLRGSHRGILAMRD